MHIHRVCPRIQFSTVWRMKRTKPHQSMDKNDSKVIQCAEHSITPLLKEWIAPTIKASSGRAYFTIHPKQNPNRVVLYDADVRFNSQFSEIDNKDIHTNEIPKSCRMYQFGFVEEKSYFPLNPANNQPIFRKRRYFKLY